MSGNIPAFVERVKAEAKDLEDKVISLEIFLKSKVVKEIGYLHEHLLTNQLAHMKAYLDVLKARISALEE